MSEEQPLKADLPIEFTEEGMINSVIDVQPSNVPSWILVIDVGSVISVSEVQLQNECG